MSTEQQVDDRLRFECRVEPHGSGGWDVQIREAHGWGSVEVDAALRRWDRIKVGGTWSLWRRVGRRPTRWTAERLARRALGLAYAEHAKNEAQNEQWRRNANRDAFIVTDTEPNR